MAIELSEYSIKAVVAEYYNMKPYILASSEKKIDINFDNDDQHDLKKVIFELKDEITSLLGYEIKNTILVIPSNHCKKFSDKVRVEAIREDQVIQKDEIATGIEQMIRKNDNEKNFVVNVVIDRYSAYGYGYVSNPVGLETRYIELEGSVYTIPTVIAYPLIKIIEECGFNVVDVCLDILAIASESVMPSALKSGAIIVDMNSTSTNIAYFKNNTMKSYKSIELGGKNITNDIALVAKIDNNKAEAFKKKYVDLNIDRIQDLVIYRYYDEYSNEDVEITQKFLSEVALSRQKEIIDLVKTEIIDLQLSEEDLFYFTGGANKINGLEHVLRYELNFPYNIISSKVLGARSSSFIKCLGAIIYEANFSRVRGEIKLFVNKKDYINSINLVEKNNLLYNNNNNSNVEQDFIKRLVSYIFNN
ncbi:cell division FtsA domain-containing protein [Mycoplasma sp. P36-A1]|uniref:cell division FtsA domain-containing protein n=1 Tax=Mycoplasma sp. P36-A1 TaxID=3252900 RepID=UPI003C2B6552